MKKLSQIISEVSTKKLVDYVAKASTDVGRRIEKAEPGVKPFKKILDRSGKIGRAKAHIQMKANEEVEQIDELGHQSLLNYTVKASRDAVDHMVKAGEFKSIADRIKSRAPSAAGKNLVKRAETQQQKSQAKANKRSAGLIKATARLKESNDMCNVCGQTPCNCTSVKEQVKMKSLRDITEASLHPDALHVSPVKVDGKTKYQVKAVGKNLSHGIKVGEHLTDTHLDDATEMGAKIKHVKEAMEVKKPKSKVNHNALQASMAAGKQAGTDESIDYRDRFIMALESNGFDAGEKLAQWAEGIINEGNPTVAHIATNIASRKKSNDADTDVIRDMDSDDTQKKAVARTKHHHNTVKNFRTYKEEVEMSEGISARQALSKAADFEFKAANTDEADAEKRLKGKAKALRRAAKLAQDVAGVVNVGIAKQ